MALTEQPAVPDGLKAALDVLRSYPGHDGTLQGVLESRCALRARQPMLVLADGPTLSWAEVATRSAALARSLHSRGVAAGDRVAVVAPNHAGHVLLLLALARLGAVLVPLNPEFGPRELHYALALADVCAVFVDAGSLPGVREVLQGQGRTPWLALLGESAPELPTLDGLIAAAPAPAPALPAPPAADAPCVMVFTSGTTGFPKGVVHSQRSLVLVGEANLGRMRLQPEDRLLVVLPFFHINALFYSLGGMLAAGAALIIAPRFSASRFWPLAVETGATAVNVIEAMGNILVARSRAEYRAGHRLRVVYGVRHATQAAFRQHFGVQHLLSGFGMSEVPGVTCNPWGEPARPGSMGVLARHPDPAQPWAHCRVVDEHGHDVPAGMTGELWVQTPVMMLGYFRDPAQTQAAFEDGWFKTGDLVRRDADGWFFHLSRLKDVIRRRGENIAGAELDQVIGEHPAVAQAAAVAVPSALGEDEILAVVVLRPGQRLAAPEVADWCRLRLAPHKVPRYVVFTDHLPLTPTHKVSKALLRQDTALRAAAVDLQAGATPSAPPAPL